MDAGQRKVLRVLCVLLLGRQRFWSACGETLIGTAEVSEYAVKHFVYTREQNKGIGIWTRPSTCILRGPARVRPARVIDRLIHRARQKGCNTRRPLDLGLPTAILVLYCTVWRLASGRPEGGIYSCGMGGTSLQRTSSSRTTQRYSTVRP